MVAFEEAVNGRSMMRFILRCDDLAREVTRSSPPMSRLSMNPFRPTAALGRCLKEPATASRRFHPVYRPIPP